MDILTLHFRGVFLLPVDIFIVNSASNIQYYGKELIKKQKKL